MSARVLRIMVADDHAIVREGLAALIGRQPDMRLVAEAENGLAAIDRWRQHLPDVGLMDLRMPVLDGVNAIREIRAVDAAARLIVLTTFDGDEDIYRGLQAGAKAFLLKDAAREELIECIRRVGAGETYVTPCMAAKLAERIGGPALTGRETEVLRLVAVGKTNKEVGVALSISETTVKSHLKALFAKLKVLSRTEAVAAANRRGIIRL